MECHPPPVPSSPTGFKLESHLGSGTFGSVWLAQHIASGERVAIKVIPKSSLRDNEAKTRFVREVSLHKMPNHPYIVPLYACTENLLNYYLIMEYVEHGTLKAEITKAGAFEEVHARRVFSQICEAVRFLHCDLGVAHRDLKAENILIDNTGTIRVIDFGLSHECNAESLLQTKCGSPRYVAPEIYSGGSAYTRAVDLWSLGILLFYIVTGYFPFDGDSRAILGERVMHKEVKFPEYLSRQLCDLISGLLRKDPRTRMTIEQVVMHPWVAAGAPCVSSCRFPSGLERFEERWKARMEMLGDTAHELKLKDPRTPPTSPRSAAASPSSRIEVIDKLCSTGRFKPKGAATPMRLQVKNGVTASAYPYRSPLGKRPLNLI